MGGYTPTADCIFGKMADAYILEKSTHEALKKRAAEIGAFQRNKKKYMGEKKKGCSGEPRFKPCMHHTEGFPERSRLLGGGIERSTPPFGLAGMCFPGRNTRSAA